MPKCPYCKVELECGDGDNTVDAVACCSLCETITCELCAELHYQREHPTHIPWVYGYLNDDGIFKRKDFSFVED